MKLLLTGGKVWFPCAGFVENCPILCDGERILAVGDTCLLQTADRTVDLGGSTVLPGLVDVHTHGCIGFDFTSATEEEMRRMKADYAAHGVTALFPTLASAAPKDWILAIRRIGNVGFDGIHFEGRYLNPKRRGAHAPELLVKPESSDLEVFLKENQLPCHITYAPELDEDGSFAATALGYGATLGVGHTDATAGEALTALSRGATSFSHLYNAMPPLHHRSGGAAAVGLTCGAYCELIADGLHVAPEMVALAYRAVGKDRLVLITDSMEATGCPDGEYRIAGQKAIVKNGKAMTWDGALAGSTLRLLDGVRNLMRFASIPLEDAIACATLNPARMVGIDGDVGSIETGKRADLIVVREDLTLQKVLYRGRFL